MAVGAGDGDEGPEVVLRPERLVAGGDALARLEDGRVAFVPGALPAETVEACVVEDRGDYVRAELRRLLEVSSDRVEPVCRHRSEGCGGCRWMHLRPAAQADAKAEIVAESLRRIGRLDATLVGRLVVPAGLVPPLGARTSIRVLGTGDGVAFREERSDRPTPIVRCPAAHPALSDLLADLDVAVGWELSLRVSAATSGVTARWSEPHRRRRRGPRRPSPTAGGDPARRPVEGLPAHVHIGDRAFLVERVAGVDLRVSAPSFFQSGPAAAELLVGAVSDAAPELVGARHAVDAYGGVGLFAATALRSAGRVTLIESARSSVADAATNLHHRGDTARIEAGAVERWRPDAADPPIDVMVADPARSGLGKPGVEAVVAADAPVVVLVSCDPVSLGRDARLLLDAGYRPERVSVLDLFPQTPHVETVTRFTR